MNQVDYFDLDWPVLNLVFNKLAQLGYREIGPSIYWPRIVEGCCGPKMSQHNDDVTTVSLGWLLREAPAIYAGVCSLVLTGDMVLETRA